MSEEEKSVFDGAEVTEELPLAGEETPEVEDEWEEFNPTVSTESPKERLERKGVKAESDGKVVTIKDIFFTRPKIKDRDGNVIPPKKTLDETKEFYPGKLGIKFEEGNLVEYYPNFHYFVNDGKISQLAKINRTGENTVSQIFQLAVKVIGKPMDEVSDSDFFAWMIGKKVKLKTVSGTYLKNKWFRNDIVEFVK